MPKSIVLVDPEFLDLFLELLPQTGAVVTGMDSPILHPYRRLHIEGDAVPDSPETVADFTRSHHAALKPDMSLRPYAPMFRPIIKTLPDPDVDVVMSASGVSKRKSDHALDGLYPYQGDFFRYLRELPASEHTNRRDGKSRISLMLAKVTDESHRRLGKSWLGRVFDRKAKP